MPYEVNGRKRFNNVEKMKYHTECANKGVDGKGNKLTMTQKVRHAMLAERCRRRVSKYADRMDLQSFRGSHY